MTEESKRDIKGWFAKTVEFEDSRYEDVKEALIRSINEHGFFIRENNEFDNALNIEATIGSRITAVLMGFIPFGKHFPAGKRFLLKAFLKGEDGLKLNIQIIPYMELFDSEEVGGLTQSMDERPTDEYFGTKKLYSILNLLYNYLAIPIPEELAEIDMGEFVKDTFLALLVYPLDGYKSSRSIHKPPASRPPWCWGGFIIPEVWFIWHEIWGVSVLTAIPLLVLVYLVRFNVEINQNTIYGLLAISLVIRAILGLFGNKIYYARYGIYPGEQDKKARSHVPPQNGPLWNWAAFFFPEYWLLWNEVWGAGVLALLIDFVCFVVFILNMNMKGFVAALVIFHGSRIIFRIKGNRLYYAQHGRFPGEGQ